VLRGTVACARMQVKGESKGDVAVEGGGIVCVERTSNCLERFQEESVLVQLAVVWLQSPI
jgi:hypothetical protein